MRGARWSWTQFDRAWAGLRPGTPDELPLLGRLPGWENVSVAGGHFRNGVLLAPITGERLARAIVDGALDRSRPFARRDAVAALKRQSGMANEPAPIRSTFTENVFPNMMISWGTYPTNIGHERFPGCFRCHDGQHVTKTGDAITQDCGACHELVAADEPSPKILKDAGCEKLRNSVVGSDKVRNGCRKEDHEQSSPVKSLILE